MSDDSTVFLGKAVWVVIDRPIGSVHPHHRDIRYKVNYGFVPNTLSSDGEALDAYVLGDNTKLAKFRGKCIAIIRRKEQDDDKLIVCPEGVEFSDKEIREHTHFQEQYFPSEILRN